MPGVHGRVEKMDRRIGMKKIWNRWCNWVSSREYPFLATIAVSLIIGPSLAIIVSIITIGFYSYRSTLHVIIGLLMYIAFGKQKRNKSLRQNEAERRNKRMAIHYNPGSPRPPKGMEMQKYSRRRQGN